MSTEVTSIEAIDVNMNDIHADDSFNCRGKIAPIDVIELARDIQENGLLQPVILSIYPKDMREETGKKYLLLAGYRRYKAHIVNKAEKIRAIIRHEEFNEIQARFLNLAENLNRQDLNIQQEAQAIKRLFDLGATQEEVMRRLGRTRGWVQIRFYLLAMPEDIQREVAAGIVTQPQLRSLYTIKTREGIKALYPAVRKIKEAKERGERGLVIDPNRKTKQSKVIRKKGEITQMLEHILTSVGGNFGTRCLAWATGELSTGELFEDIKKIADENGRIYHIPSDVEWSAI